MFVGDMNLKRKIGLQKVLDAIELHHGTTILSAGITSMVPGIATAAAEAAGIRMFEISQNGVALNQGLDGVTNRRDGRKISYKVPMVDMAKQVVGTRNVVLDDVYIAVSVPGLWTHTSPTPFLEEHALLLSYSGADGLHVHKSTVEDYHEIAGLAHRYGMLIDAYVSPAPSDLDVHSRSYSGVSASTLSEVETRVKELEDAGVDMIGLDTGKGQMGLKAGEIAPEIRERGLALIGAATVPTLIEGGVTPLNAPGYTELGFNILVVGTVFDDLVRKTIRDTITEILKQYTEE